MRQFSARLSESEKPEKFKVTKVGDAWSAVVFGTDAWRPKSDVLSDFGFNLRYKNIKKVDEYKYT